MKNKLFKYWDWEIMTSPCLVLTCALIALLWIGCTTQNPQYTPILPGQPQTNTVPQYIPNPSINTLSNTATGIANTVAPLNPYAGLTSWAINLIFGAIGGVSGFLAQKKNTSAQQAAADVLAGVVAKNNLAPQALANAGAAASTVAQHIDNNTTT